MAKKINSPGGSGRGRKGVIVNDEMERPDCPDCGNFMRSCSVDWRCTVCDKHVRKIKKDAGIKAYNESLGFDPEKAEAHAVKCSKGTRLLITSAQNNSTVSIKSLKSLKQAAKHFKCEIAVIPSHYRNTTLWDRGDVKEFDDIIKPYLVKGEFKIGNLKVKSDVRIQPTTISPLSGKHSHSGKSWICFGHPQQQLEPVPTLGTFPKRMYTTGSITEPNYTVSDAGAKAEHHHCMSALIVEKIDNEFSFIRQLSFDDNGNFYDLDKHYSFRGVTSGHRIAGLNPGDTHVKWNIVEKITFRGKNSVVGLLRPLRIFHNDVYDGYSISHHHSKKPMIKFIKHHSQDDDCKKELDETVEFLNKNTPKSATCYIVPSNHHDHLAQFLDRADANSDPVNALLILELQTAMREAALKGENHDPFYLYCKDRLTCKFVFLSRNEPFLVKGVDHSQHGDVGSNGSRGSARNLAKNPAKCTIGHSHGARIFQGVFQAGTSTGRLEYERGISDHSTSHVALYEDGKRTIIDIYKNKFKK